MLTKHRIIGSAVSLVNPYETAHRQRMPDVSEFSSIPSVQPEIVPLMKEKIPFMPEQHHNPPVTDVITAPAIAVNTTQTGIAVSAFRSQTQRFVGTLQSEQARLNEHTQAYLAQKYASGEPLTATVLRNKSNWYAVKSLRVRAELMKMQMGGKVELPLAETQLSEIAEQIQGLDLNNLNDTRVRTVIDNILKPDDMFYMDALKKFQRTGKTDELFQTSKMDELSAHLQEHDLDSISGKEFKYIKENFMQKTEIHHRTSISTDPYQQSDINNLDILNTTQHDIKHTDPNTGKIDYRRQTTESPIDQIQLLHKTNRNRIIVKELTGLGIATAIGLGTGFAIGFVVSLAQNGLNPESLKYAFISGAKQGVSTSAMALASTVIGRTIGEFSSKAISNVIINTMQNNATITKAAITQSTIVQISDIVNFSVVGSLTILAFSIYEFAKLKKAGYTTKESILRTAKSASVSMSMLALSVITQGIWGGMAGMIVSVVSGIAMIGFSVCKISHDKSLMREIMYFSAEKCVPLF